MCNVAYVSRQASSGSDGHASTPTVSMLGEGIVGIARVAHAPLWLLDRRNRGQMRTGSNRRHASPLLRIARCVKLTKNEGPCGGGSRRGGTPDELWPAPVARWHLRGYAEYH